MEKQPPERSAPLDARTRRQRDAFEAFFQRFEQPIFGYLWRMTRSEQAAFDLTQETFVRAWQHFDAIGEHRETGGWLFRVASNLALTYLKRQSARPLAPLDDTLPGGGDPGGRLAEQEIVLRTLQALTPKQRGALVLHEVYGLSCDEVGAALGLSRAAVKMALWRARETFRERYLREEADV
ncbi:MAG TPA: RNA polymerase sigma factor [Ktedonobacterales bacterium]|nr:RNA polymerase sigma factor [Ktedonobacterales bacterium]